MTDALIDFLARVPWAFVGTFVFFFVFFTMFFRVNESRRMFHSLQQKVIDIMTTQAEVVATIAAIGEKLAKIGTETVSLKEQIQELQALLGDGSDASPELVAAVEALAAQAQVVDDLVQDAVPVG